MQKSQPLTLFSLTSLPFSHFFADLSNGNMAAKVDGSSTQMSTVTIFLLYRKSLFLETAHGLKLKFQVLESCVGWVYLRSRNFNVLDFPDFGFRLAGFSVLGRGFQLFEFRVWGFEVQAGDLPTHPRKYDLGLRDSGLQFGVWGVGIPFAAHRDKSREWGRLKAKVKPLLTLGDRGCLSACE